MNLCAEDTVAQADVVYGGPRAAGDTFGSAIARMERAVVESCDEPPRGPWRFSRDPAGGRGMPVTSR